MKTYDAVIIGAGSVGTILSYWLARKGLKVAVLEKNASPGRGEHRAAIGGVRATHSDPAKIKIGLRSLEFLRRLQPEFGYDVDYVEGGYLFPAYQESIAAKLKGLLAIQKDLGLNIDWIGPEEVVELVPGIREDGLLGGTYSPEDGHLSPLKLASAFYRMALSAGVDFYFRTTVTGFVTAEGKVTEIKTDGHSFSSDIVVNAAGASARQIGLMLGTDLPVVPDAHEAGVTEPVERFFYPMVVDIEPTADSENYYFYQDPEGSVIFCITPRPKRLGATKASTSEFLPMVVPRLLRLCPRLRYLKVRRVWRGMYPGTPDDRPIVGFDAALNGVFHTVGMCGQGLMLGPGLGQLVADALVGELSPDDEDVFELLSPYREFTAQELLR
ncbi:MAG: FAD-binding oxidoreductase [Firmicutes bacterium]|nr:FAD-binding oxidoreductase [Bacillota bacterium]